MRKVTHHWVTESKKEKRGGRLLPAAAEFLTRGYPQKSVTRIGRIEKRKGAGEKKNGFASWVLRLGAFHRKDVIFAQEWQRSKSSSDRFPSLKIRNQFLEAEHIKFLRARRRLLSC